MITLALEKDNPSLDVLLEMATDETVIVTQGNKPVFAVILINEEDIQTWRLGENPDFLALMQRSWARLHEEGPVSLAEARRRLLSTY